jgi:hypothetical protein
MNEYQLELDHVVIVVPELERAIQQYRSLGFIVSRGGDNGPTHNALIPFVNGTYIELISTRSRLLRGVFRFLYRSKLIVIFKSVMSALSFRFVAWMGGPTGVRDWCVKQAKLDSLIDTLSANDIGMSKIEKFTRIKPNLEIVEWLLVAPINQRLPFFIRDITDPTVRIPGGEAASHSNGCTGISRLLLNDNDYFSIRRELKCLHHHAISFGNDSANTAVKLVKDQDSQITLELTTPSAVAILEIQDNKGAVLLFNE